MPGPNPHVKTKWSPQVPAWREEADICRKGGLSGDRGSLKVNMPPQNLTSLFSKSDYSWEYRSTARKMYTPYLPRLIPVPSVADVLERQGKISVYKCTHHPSISFPRGKGRVTAPKSPGSYQEAQMEEEQNLEQMLIQEKAWLNTL